MSQQQAPADFGRVDPDGTVYVRVGDTERSVGQIPDSTPEEALRFYTRRYENLAAEVTLLVSRVEAQAMSPEDARKAARAEQNASTIAAKQAMVDEAESLAGGNDWRRGVDRFRELLEEWKALPRVDRTTDNDLWHRFSSARTQYTRRRKAHFSELNARRDEAKRLKEEIIAEATPLAESTDWGPTTGAFRDLMARWRAAGSARRADDESLWARFHALQDQFFNARSAAQHAVDDAQAENLRAKTALLEQAEHDLEGVTDVDAAKSTLRGFLSRFSEIGHVPRAAMRDLDSRVRKLSDRVGELEAERWRRTDPEARKRAEDTVALFQSQVDKLTKDLNAAEAAGDARKAKDVRKSLETYTSWLDQARQTLQDFQDM